MKIAIVSDWLITFAGAEKVLADILHTFPTADLYAVVDFLKPEDRTFLFNKKAKTTFIQRLPFSKKYYRAYLPFMPLAIEQLNVKQYDLVISSSHAVAKGILTDARQLHICYIHSPMRYAWDMQHEYLKDSGLTQGFKSLFAKYLLHKMRLWDQRTANGVDYFLANSQFIANRVWKTYRRKATVLHPAIDLDIFKPTFLKEDFFLAASRMVPYKKMALIAESFTHMPDKKLIIIGDGPEFKKVKKFASQNIQILGYQPTDVLVHYLQKAKAFIFAAEEDFGLLPLEAQACGTPVIAYQQGGASETVRDFSHEKPTGIFFKEQTVRDICQAIHLFSEKESSFTSENCRMNAERFSRVQFRDQLQRFISTKLAEHHSESRISHD